jgi:hypothetical protein
MRLDLGQAEPVAVPITVPDCVTNGDRKPDACLCRSSPFRHDH